LSASDEYLTVRGRGTKEIKVKGSRFIAAAAPVGSEEEAKTLVGQISREHHDATHNCYAYRVGHGDEAVFRFSDAGEPSGTAGKPILEAIECRGLTDVAVVVTRYFGGTKLGTGGLARAYRESAQAVLEKVGTITAFLTDDFTVSFPYDLTKEIRKLLGKHDVRVLGEKYGHKTSLSIRIRKSRSERFREELAILGGEQVKVRNVS
jgi:uncharacterized YigZ family protein